MKSKEQIITEMCYTFRHDYGIIKENPFEIDINSGMTRRQREILWNDMEKLYDIVVSGLSYPNSIDMEERLTNFEKLFESFKKEVKEKLDTKADRITFQSGVTPLVPSTVTPSYKKHPTKEELELIEFARGMLRTYPEEYNTHKVAQAFMDQFVGC